MENKKLNLIDIINDETFNLILTKELIDIENKINNRPNPGPGYHYKRNIYDEMIENNQLNTDFFIKNIVQIWIKKSDLSSNVRNIILHHCHNSIKEFLKQK